MKIAFVTRSLAGGGAERVVSVLANSFCKMKEIEKVSIIAVIEDKVTYPVDSSVEYIPNRGSKTGKIGRVIQRGKFLRDAIKEIRPDVIISFCTQINIYSIIMRCGLPGKLIICERNDPNNDPVQKYVRKLRDIIYRFCDASVYQTPDAAKYFEKIVRKPFEIIPNPIKEDLPKPYEGIRDKRVVTVARLSDAKNLPMLIRAFEKVAKEHPDYKLEIYGEGPERDNLNALIRECHLENSIRLMGFSTEVHDKILAAACFVLPSNYEGISNAMLEALGIGLPAVCTDCPIGGARMMIRHMENGILIPVNDQSALENAILNVIEDVDLQKRLSREAVKINQLLSADSICKKWYEFIQSMIA